MNHSINFDQKFAKIDHFQKYSQMKPWVGCHYADAKVKIMHICESHYFKRQPYPSANEWYAGIKITEHDDDWKWTHTRGVICNFVLGRKERPMYKYPGHAIGSGLGTGTARKTYRHIAFMNFFQRPAPENKKYFKHHCKEVDIKKANDVFQAVVSIIRPDGVVFTSKLAFDNLKKESREILTDSGGKLVHTKHPSHLQRTGKWKGEGKQPIIKFVRSLQQENLV